MTAIETASSTPVGNNENASAIGIPRIAPDAEAVVRCINLSKTYRDFWFRARVRAVDQINLEIRRGEVFGLLGPNGSGKSTTIKMILGLLHPTAGRIVVYGKRPEDVATKKIIGYLPEESYLYKFLNARETLDYYGCLFHLSAAQRRRRIDDLLEMVGLERVAHRPVGEYSKGMQRRIGLAQALINDPQLLILDEPTTGLDPIGSRQIKDLIIKLCQAGKTILLCSHLLSDVEDVCHRVSIMFGGKVRAYGTVDELLTRQDQTTVQTSRLDEQQIEDLKTYLAAKGRPIEKIEHPRQRLESLFLEIVERANAEGAATSGARSGGKIAQFLVSEKQSEGQELIDDLVARAKEPSPVIAPAPTLAQLELAEQKVKEEVAAKSLIEQLARPKARETPVIEQKPESKPQEKPDQSVIDSLLGGDAKDQK